MSVVWTLENFGERQAETCAEMLSLAIEPGIRTLHVARQSH